MSRHLTRLVAALALLIGCNTSMPPTAPDAAPVDPGRMLSGPTVTGRWMRTGYAVTGTASLTIDGTTARLELSSDFSIGQAPGPTLYLNTQSNPNAGQPLRIGALRNRTGAQSYTFQVPPGVRYTRIIIWCDPFNVAMAEVTIPPTGG
jgi:hypothetical protein